MANAVLIVLSSPVDGEDEEYNRWYDSDHLDEVLAIPGFVAAQRFEPSEAQLDDFPGSAHRYVAIYEVEGDPGEALGRLQEEVATGRIALPAAIDVGSIRPWCFTPITARMTTASA
jgi:hypothetical protein